MRFHPMLRPAASARSGQSPLLPRRETLAEGSDNPFSGRSPAAHKRSLSRTGPARTLAELLLLLVKPEESVERRRAREIELAQVLHERRFGWRRRGDRRRREKAELCAAAPASARESCAASLVQLLRLQVAED